MLKNVQKNVAFTEFLKYEDGFTLINSLLRLFLISISLPILVFVFTKIKVISNEESLMVNQLFFILQNESFTAEDVYQIGNRLYFKLNHVEVATIEQYNNVLRRRVDNRGHEIYLRNIQSFHLEPLNYGINIKIETEKGDIYERTLITR